MEREEVTKTYIMISNWQNTFCLYGLYKNSSAFLKIKRLPTPDTTPRRVTPQRERDNKTRRCTN